MHSSEHFLRFASECDGMARFSDTAVKRAVWQDLAQRWRRCAELARDEDSTAYIDRLRKRQFKQFDLQTR
jgi:hypothetical protein